MLDVGLAGVHVLVTGANGGIGLPTVKLFLEQGAFVTAVYNTTSVDLDSDPTITLYKTRNTCRTISLDVTDEDAVSRSFVKLFENSSDNGWPPLSCLVVNHGIFTTPSVPIWEMTLAQFERTQRINLFGPFLLIRAFLKGYKTYLSHNSLSSERSSQITPPNIVIIGSTSAEFGESGHVDYSVSKSGLTHGLMLSVKNEIVRIHPRGRINSVSPGWVATGMAEESLKDEETRWRATATTPMKKIATPLEVAYQVLVMSSDVLSGHTTGQIVMVAGGMEGRLLNPKP